jgi:hypothetical protein
MVVEGYSKIHACEGLTAAIASKTVVAVQGGGRALRDDGAAGFKSAAADDMKRHA